MSRAGTSSGGSAADISQLLENALQAHMGGDMKLAHQLYTRILKADPKNAAALHYAGVLAFQSGKTKDARKMISKALRLEPDNAEANSNLGLVLFELGQYSDAITRFAKALDVFPQSVNALVNLGMTLEALHRYDEAEARYAEALSLEPNSSETLFNLANTIAKQKRHEEAIATYLKALELEPGLVGARVNLGRTYTATGQFPEAIDVFGAALKNNPGDTEALKLLADVHYCQGAQLENQGETEGALSCFETAVSVHAEFAEAYVRIGSLRKALGQPDEALAAYIEALHKDPDFSGGHFNLANLLADIGRHEDAVTHYGRAVHLDPSMVEAHQNLGNVLRKLNRHDEARASYQRGLDIDPRHAGSLYGMGRHCKEMGDFDGAIDRYREVLAREPAHVEALYELAVNFPEQFDEPLRTQAIALFDNPATADQQKAVLAFALSSLSKFRKDFDTAFQYLLEANRLRRPSRYRVADERPTFDAFVRTLDDQTVAASSPGGASTITPIFIVGMPRSGTTLVEQVLSCHPDVSAAGEVTYLDNSLHQLFRETGRRFPDDFAAFDDGDIAFVRGQYLSMIPETLRATSYVTDKLPHNFRHLAVIRKAFPNAPIVHVRRDPMDTCLSIFEANFGDVHAYAHDLADLGEYYLMYADFMARCRAVIGIGLYELAYEDLVETAEPEIRQLLDFCGLAFHADCLSPHEARRTVKTASNVQVRQPITNASVERWRVYEAHLQPLLDILETVAGPADLS